MHRKAPIGRVWLLGLLLYALDFLIKRFPLWREPWSVQTWLDGYIPFRPEWVWVYLPLWLLFIFGGGAFYLLKCREDRRRIAWAVATLLVMQLGAWCIHLLFPTYMPRPPLPEGGGLSLELVRLIYRVDPPTHVFPSLHVASTYVVAYFLGYQLPYVSPRTQRLLRVLGHAMVVLIGLSTLFIKQHGVVDVLGGILWGHGAVQVGRVLGLQGFLRTHRIPLVERGTPA